MALDRLERAGYVVRERNPADRRSVIVRVVPERIREMKTRYRKINAGLERILASFSEAELRTIHAFFTRANATPRPTADRSGEP